MLPTPCAPFPNNIKNAEAAARLRGTVLDRTVWLSVRV